MLTGMAGSGLAFLRVVEPGGTRAHSSTMPLSYQNLTNLVIPVSITIMRLLTIDEIQAGLDDAFLPLEPMITGCRLFKRTLATMSVDHVETSLATRLPRELRDFLCRYDLGSLTIGPIVFGVDCSYLGNVIEWNTNTRWWGIGQRPAELLMIAISDPFALLLNTRTGGVLAMDTERSWQDAPIIATSFCTFFRGIGTVMLSRNATVDHVELARAVSVIVGSGDVAFWQFLAH